MAIVEYEVFAPAEILTETEQRARTLEAAALEIEVRGHAKHTLMWDYDFENTLCPDNKKGSVCLSGAILCAKGWNGGNTSDFSSLGSFGMRLGEAIDFNNARDTKAEEVTFLLRWRAEEIRDGWDA